MPNKVLTRAEMQSAVDALARAGGEAGPAAAAERIPESTLRNRLKRAAELGLKPSSGTEDMSNPAHLRMMLKRAEKALADNQREALSEEQIKRAILQMKQAVDELKPPTWLVQARPGNKSPGVPLLFLSDLHWGEKVEPSQINGVNRYSVKIAHKRMQTLAEGAGRLLSIISPELDYPGIVIPLGGDMISGNIHDELTATNELNSMDSVLDLFSALVGFIGGMADRFGKVFCPCVTGNHGRDTHKIWNKDRHRTSFDWLLYCFLAKHFEDDKRVSFFIPDGPDAYFRVFNHRYLLTHGDQFRGGDGMIGALGPIIRGDHKKRSRNAQIEMEYDTMMLGHWHQYIHLTRLIVNGSLKGYDEYAYNNNFGFEYPQQALWITHPKYGITFRSPVFVEREERSGKSEWVSVAA
jgi:hypothetical protein